MPEEIGIVISSLSPPTHTSFDIELQEDIDTWVGDFVEVPCAYGVIVGRVISITAENEYFKNPAFVKDHLVQNEGLLLRYKSKYGRYIIARVKVVGILRRRHSTVELLPPMIPPEPGTPVYRPSEITLRSALGLSSSGIFLGTLWGHDDIRIELDLDLLVRHHVAIIGATGSGKSYACGVLIEELVKHNLPVIVFDPHSEYWTMKYPNASEEHLLNQLDMYPAGFRVKIFSPVGSEVADEPLSVSLIDLGPEGIAELCGMSETQEDLLFLAFKKAIEDCGDDFTVDDLDLSVRKVAHDYGFLPTTVLAVRRRLTVLNELGVIDSSLDPRNLVERGRISIIDLSSPIPERARRALVGAVLRRLFSARRTNSIPPLMVVVEEGHRFAPQNEEVFSKDAIRLIAREGRKFGIGISIISQRVVGLDKDIFSQCGTMLIMKVTCTTDISFLKPLIEASGEAERLSFLPRGVGVLSSICLHTPVLIKVRPRMSMHGGGGKSINGGVKT